MIIGIDEVGRGCWAGPLLVVAASATAALPIGLTDSKLLSKQQRNALVGMIKDSCKLGEGWVEPYEIDQIGLTAAMKLGVKRALNQLKAGATQKVVIDGKINYCPDNFLNVSCIVRADALVPIVSAASVYAKVTRDEYMAKQAQEYPHYGFEHHVGYGTAAHILALRELGVCKLHRLSYKPVKAFVV